jgi:hypothetical protein
VTSPRHLLDQVRLLERRGRRRRNADLKRATSTLYYVLFHALAHQCANTLIGQKHRQSEAWVRVYRALDHGKARTEFKRIALIKDLAVLWQVAKLFIDLQDLRHHADYDPGPSRLSAMGVEEYYKLVNEALAAMDAVPAETWREIVTIILLKDRKSFP